MRVREESADKRVGPTRLDWLTGRGAERGMGPRVRPCLRLPVHPSFCSPVPVVWCVASSIPPTHPLTNLFFFLPPSPVAHPLPTQAQLSLHSLTARAARSVRTVVPTTTGTKTLPSIFFSFPHFIPYSPHRASGAASTFFGRLDTRVECDCIESSLL